MIYSYTVSLCWNDNNKGTLNNVYFKVDNVYDCGELLAEDASAEFERVLRSTKLVEDATSSITDWESVPVCLPVLIISHEASCLIRAPYRPTTK